jgi:hypothetical protein
MYVCMYVYVCMYACIYIYVYIVIHIIFRIDGPTVHLNCQSGQLVCRPKFEAGTSKIRNRSATHFSVAFGFYLKERLVAQYVAYI